MLGGSHPASRDTPKGLLPSGVPDLELNILAVQVDYTRSELDTDGNIVHALEALVGELQQDEALADAAVFDYYLLEGVPGLFSVFFFFFGLAFLFFKGATKRTRVC